MTLWLSLQNLFEGAVNTVGIAMLSVSDREEYDDPDNETVNADHKVTQFVEKIDKVRFFSLQERKSSVLLFMIILISNSCFNQQTQYRNNCFIS